MRPDGHDGAGWRRRAVTRPRGRARRPFSGRLEGVSGNLRVVGALRIGDLRSPRVKGRGETGTRQGALAAPSGDGPAWSLLAVREAGGQESGCLPCDERKSVVLGAARIGVSGLAWHPLLVLRLEDKTTSEER